MSTEGEDQGERVNNTPEEIRDAAIESIHLVDKWLGRNVKPQNMIMVTQVQAAMIYFMFAGNPSTDEFEGVLTKNLEAVYEKAQSIVNRIRKGG